MSPKIYNSNTEIDIVEAIHITNEHTQRSTELTQKDDSLQRYWKRHIRVHVQLTS